MADGEDAAPPGVEMDVKDHPERNMPEPDQGDQQQASRGYINLVNRQMASTRKLLYPADARK